MALLPQKVRKSAPHNRGKTFKQSANCSAKMIEASKNAEEEEVKQKVIASKDFLDTFAPLHSHCRRAADQSGSISSP
jgi:hypothetical protein